MLYAGCGAGDAGPTLSTKSIGRHHRRGTNSSSSSSSASSRQIRPEIYYGRPMCSRSQALFSLLLRLYTHTETHVCAICARVSERENRYIDGLFSLSLSLVPPSSGDLYTACARWLYKKRQRSWRKSVCKPSTGRRRLTPYFLVPTTTRGRRKQCLAFVYAEKCSSRYKTMWLSMWWRVMHAR